jgi:hypothetical protein
LIETIFGIFRQPNDCVGGDINGTAPWDVVEHELSEVALGNGGENGGKVPSWLGLL